MVRDLYDDAKAEPSLMERVKEVQANLDVKFPTFVKLMIRSNVNVGFLLVYIVRTSELDEVDGANALLHLKADTRRCNSEITNEATSIGNTSRARNLSLSNHDGFTSRRESSKALEEACPSLGSLHARLDRLDSLALEATEAIETQKDRRTMPGRVQTEEEQKTLQ
ncbi:hypothetical protein Acr_00g0066040 [Actinidia rufa]|uniref:Uncharacterized protein n=1 Tax=Actinidia rufa TaxID=165716 RepID=A0A7J0DPZ2_9ERIC|nr:hypothetical protein Acr_00g0066040 [Actinidia rufa]